MAPANLLLLVVLAIALLMFIGTVLYILYTSTRDSYRRFKGRVHDYYVDRELIKQWEQEELNREYPREWYGSH